MHYLLYTGVSPILFIYLFGLCDYILLFCLVYCLITQNPQVNKIIGCILYITFFFYSINTSF